MHHLHVILIVDIRPIVSAIFFTLVYQPNWFNKYLANFNYKYTFLMINIIIIIIGLLVYNYYYFLLYTRFHSSPVEHENLRSKVVLTCNSTNFFKIIFLNVQKKKYRINVVSIFQIHDLLVKVKSISNKWKKPIAKTISLRNIYLIWYRYSYPRFRENMGNPC